MNTKEEIKFIPFRLWLPKSGIEFYCQTEWGIRKAISEDKLFFGYRFTDCTHPLQNCYLSSFSIEGWRYVDMNNHLLYDPILNTPQMQWDADQLLKQVLAERQPLTLIKKIGKFITDLVTLKL